MAGFVGQGGPRKLRAEINVTPLVDVVLVLLIIFMVVTPLLSRGRDVTLPVVGAGEGEQEKAEAIVVTLSKEGGLWLEDQKVRPDRLGQVLKTRLGEQSSREVLIKADSTVSVRELRPVLQQLKSVQITQIGFVVGESGRAAP